MADCCECGKERLGTVKRRKYLKMKNYTKMDVNKCSMKVWANLPEHAKECRVFGKTALGNCK